MNRRKLIQGAFSAASALKFGLAGSAVFAQPALAAPEDVSDFLISPEHPLQLAWQLWKSNYLTPEGRVVDGFQENASHSEGQGYGLVLAASFGDLEACQRIIDWTETNLAIRQDGLLAWRWMEDGSPQVPDTNNASDGDLFYAWGLTLLHRQTGDRGTYARAKRIMMSLENNCIRPAPDGSGRLLFLPGSSGFSYNDGFIVNPSYYMARAFRELGEMYDLPNLKRLALDGELMMGEIADVSAIPDWVYWGPSGIAIAPEPFSGASGYEALRVPLFTLWSDDFSDAAVIGENARNRVQNRVAQDYRVAGLEGGTPTVFDPNSGAVVERSAHAGYKAIAALNDCVLLDETGSLMPGFSDEQPYYPATLHLMALLVQVNLYPKCVPI